MEAFGFTPSVLLLPTGRSRLSDSVPLQVRSEVVFGTPSKNCSGNGICMLTQHRMASSFGGPCPKVWGWLRINTARQEVFLEFDCNALSEEIQQKHFIFPLFYMEETVRIPLSISKKWKIGGRIFLASGYYPVLRQDGKITLVLKYGPADLH